MLIADSHVHSCFSSDSEATVESMIQSAIRRGSKIFYLTDHQDFDYPIQPDERDFLIDMNAYLQTFEVLREKYSSQIELRLGVELGLMSQIQSKTSAFAAKYPFDFVIGSSHLVHGRDPYYPEYYTGRTDQAAYLEYFESILENVRVYDCFHVYGHLDYVVRYGPNKDTNYHPSDYEEVFREILRVIIEKGKGIEINTGSLYKGFSFPHPHRDILRWYHEMGGEIITIGSDAHKPDYVGYGFDQAEQLLKETGFLSYSVFREGKPIQIPLT